MSSMNFILLCLSTLLAATAGDGNPANGSCHLQVRSSISDNGMEPQSLSFGCSALCMSDDVNITKQVLLSVV